MHNKAYSHHLRTHSFLLLYFFARRRRIQDYRKSIIWCACSLNTEFSFILNAYVAHWLVIIFFFGFVFIEYIWIIRIQSGAQVWEKGLHQFGVNHIATIDSGLQPFQLRGIWNGRILLSSYLSSLILLLSTISIAMPCLVQFNYKMKTKHTNLDQHLFHKKNLCKNVCLHMETCHQKHFRFHL